MSEFSQKKIESDKRIAQYLTEARKAGHSSILYANTTIEELDNQNEVLTSVEHNLDSQEAMIDESLRKIRGMTWSGAFYNAYSDVVTTISTTISSPNPSNPDSKSKSENEKSYSSNVSPYEHEPRGSQQLLGSSTETSSATKSEEDQLLDDIFNAASALKQMGLSMGQKLEDQNQYLDSIEKKSDQVHDKTLAVSIKASQLTQKESKKDRYLGTFQLMNTSNSYLLCANGDNLELTNVADPSTLFQAILRQDTIVGLRNERTGKYVGITMWGSIAVSGNYFGSQEECYMELTGNETGILFIAKNWGAGGWLKAPSSESTTNTTSQDDIHIILNDTTKSANDRENRMIVKAIHCK